MAFSENFNVELEYRFSNSFSLSAALSQNKWKANKGNIDGTIVNADQKYLAIDLDLKYYYDEAFGSHARVRQYCVSRKLEERFASEARADWD